MSNSAAGYDNPAVIDLSDGTEVPYRESGEWPYEDEHRGGGRTFCRKCVSPINSLAFAVLFLSGALCVVSCIAPFWVYYPKRWAAAEVHRLVVVYPFKHATWRGLWAVCYKEPDLNPRITQSFTPNHCVWFGDRDTAWNSIPGSYAHLEQVRACVMGVGESEKFRISHVTWTEKFGNSLV